MSSFRSSILGGLLLIVEVVITPTSVRAVESEPATVDVTAEAIEQQTSHYAQRLLTLEGRPTSPEENGAAKLWQAVWPGHVPERFQAPLCRELGIAIPALSGFEPIDGLEVRDRIVAWLEETRKSVRPEDLVEAEKYDRGLKEDALDVEVSAWQAPWTEREIPPLAEWVKENERYLEEFVTAAAMPRWYDPSPTLLQDPPSVICPLEYGAMQVRSAIRSLNARAMLSVGSGRYDDAWQDCRACLQLSNHLGSSPSGIKQLLAAAIQTDAQTAIESLLSRRDVEITLTKQIRRDLTSMSIAPPVTTALNTSERWSMLQLVAGARSTLDDLDPPHPFNQLKKSDSEISLDAVLERINEWHDRALAAAHEPTAPARVDAVRELRAAAEEYNLSEEQLRDRLNLLGDPQAKGRLIGDVISGTSIDMSLLLIEAADRSACRMQLLTLAATLAEWQAEHNEFPASLAALGSGTAEFVLDPYSQTGESFRYERRGDGLLLYSIGVNGVDDHGSDASGTVVNGEWVETPVDVESGADELVLRLPRQEFDNTRIRPGNEQRPAGERGPGNESETPAEAE